LREAAAGSTVRVCIDGELFEIDGVMFCAGTLWTDYDLFDVPDSNMKRATSMMNDFSEVSINRRQYTMQDAQREMNDYRKIRLRKHSGERLNKQEVPRRITPADLLGFHRATLANIKRAMVESFAAYKKLVVVTHHAPSRISLLWGDETEDDYMFKKSDPCYASNLDYLMMVDDAPEVWIHGHTHVATSYQVDGGKTRVCSNPKGYEQGEDTGFELGRLVEV